MTKPELTLRLAKARSRDFLAGCPWLFKGDYVESSEQLLCTPGTIADVTDTRGQFLARGTFHPTSSIPFREITRKAEPIDAGFMVKRIEAALARRTKLYRLPYYRLLHSEGDGLAGLVIDRFGDILACQISTAGMERLWPLVEQALMETIKPAAILLKNHIPARAREGLAQETKLIKGDIPPMVEVIENDCLYFADLLHGQKTGWFYDQRDNRAFIASLTQRKTLLDVFSHSGGFGLLAAKSGASDITFVDSSALALSLARQAALQNGVEARCHFIEADAIETCEQLAAQGESFDVVTIDPPAFIKAPKDLNAGLKAYGKVTRAASALVKPGGILYVASCSHRASRPLFEKAVMEGLHKAGRKGKAVKRMGAGPDHPNHPKLQQNEYLKSITLRLD